MLQSLLEGLGNIIIIPANCVWNAVHISKFYLNAYIQIYNQCNRLLVTIYLYCQKMMKFLALMSEMRQHPFNYYIVLLYLE
jgi:hypothetical protein